MRDLFQIFGYNPGLENFSRIGSGPEKVPLFFVGIKKFCQKNFEMRFVMSHYLAQDFHVAIVVPFIVVVWKIDPEVSNSREMFVKSVYLRESRQTRQLWPAPTHLCRTNLKLLHFYFKFFSFFHSFQFHFYFIYYAFWHKNQYLDWRQNRKSPQMRLKLKKVLPNRLAKYLEIAYDSYNRRPSFMSRYGNWP